MTSTRLNLDDCPDSMYAQELRRGLRGLRFAPNLEDQFVSWHLQNGRFRIRIWWYTAIVLVPLFSLLRINDIPPWGLESWFRVVFMLLLVYSVSLTYSPQFETKYRHQSPWLIPVGSVAAIILSTAALLRGDDARLVAVAATMMCVFLISGALFRTAVVSCVLMLLTYSVMVLSAAVPAHFVWPSIGWLSVVTIIGIAFGWDKERLQRHHFLETGLINELAERDGLTQVKNRRAYDRQLERVWQQAIRDRRSVAVMLIDVDHFKHYNDHYGHQAGDDTLRKVARTIEEFARRPLDLAARYGGEEFSMILYDIAPDAALKLAEQLRATIEKQAIEHLGSPDGTALTISIGIALVQPASGRSAKTVVQLADEALYAAKQAGRNRVELNNSDYGAAITGAFNSPRIKQNKL
ncbi:MAG: GGDEF domain-containing protein [Steroidobacteraceae bacterium]